MKHLKLRAELLEDMKTALLYVEEQSHFGYAFGDKGTNRFICPSVKRNQVTIWSDTRANFRPNEASSYFWTGSTGNVFLYVNGEHALDKCSGVEIPANLWPEIKEAVLAYNEWGSTQ